MLRSSLYPSGTPRLTLTRKEPLEGSEIAITQVGQRDGLVATPATYREQLIRKRRERYQKGGELRGVSWELSPESRNTRMKGVIPWQCFAGQCLLLSFLSCPQRSSL